MTVAALLLLQAALLAYFGSFPSHFHQDELETAYASYRLPALAEIDWLGPYPADGWVAKFPILFFALQAPFLKLLGPSMESVRLSTWPYQALTVVYLWLLGRTLLGDRLIAVCGVLLYLLFAPALYLGSLGVHFHSSTLCMLAAVYHAMVLRGRWHAVALGGFLGASYLTYTASYLALPLVAIVVLATRTPWRLVGIAIVAFAAVMAPFVYGALTRYDFLTERSGQTVELPTIGHAAASLRALRDDGLVGVTGYDFGRLAPLDDVTLGLIVVGLAAAVWSAWHRRAALPLLPAIVCLAGFAAGMVLTTPTGALHRAVVVFPFLALLCAQGLLAARRWPLVVAAVVVTFALVQLPRAVRMVERDQSHPSPAIAALLRERVAPGERITVVGLLHYHLARELTIRLGDRYEIVAAAWPELPAELGAAAVVYQPSDEKLARVRGTESVFFEGGETNDHVVVLRAGR